MLKKTKESAIYWACYSECIIYHSKPKFCISPKPKNRISKIEIDKCIRAAKYKYLGKLRFNQSKRKNKYKAIILAVLNDKLKAKMYKLGISALENYVYKPKPKNRISKIEIDKSIRAAKYKYLGKLRFNQSKRKNKYKAIILAVLNDKLKAKMYKLGISALENYVPISEIQAKKHACEIKRHYVYTDFSTYEWNIIDCPILKKAQIDSNKSGYQISMLNVDKYNINETKKVYRRK